MSQITSRVRESPFRLISHLREPDHWQADKEVKVSGLNLIDYLSVFAVSMRICFSDSALEGISIVPAGYLLNDRM